MVLLEVPPRVSELHQVGAFMALGTFVRFTLNVEALAGDSLMAVPALVPAFFLALAERRKTGDFGIQWLALMTLCAWAVLLLEISNFIFYLSFNMNNVVYVNLTLSIFFAILPCAFLGFRGYALLRDALTQSALAALGAGNLRLDHYQLI